VTFAARRLGDVAEVEWRQHHVVLADDMARVDQQDVHAGVADAIEARERREMEINRSGLGGGLKLARGEGASD
jgi:hypothetical protein